MDDSELNDLVAASIRGVLPNLTSDIVSSLFDKLKSLGVSSKEDLYLIQENDLISILKPIQSRRLISFWKQANEKTPEHHGPSSASTEILSSSSASNSPPAQSPTALHFDVNWAVTFEVPWQKLPRKLMDFLDGGMRPAPKRRREMVRIIVDEMLILCGRPSKKNIAEIARKLVAKYPQSLKDIIEGETVGSGCDSLVKQLQSRIENLRRPSSPKLRRGSFTDGSEIEEIPPAKKRATMQDTYGCINWEKSMPSSETKASQQQHKEKLKKMFTDRSWDHLEVKESMQKTFSSQRQDINGRSSIECLLENWPFLFEEDGLEVHFLELTGIPLTDTYHKSMEKKAKRLFGYMKHMVAGKHTSVMQILKRLEQAKDVHCSPEMAAFVELLLAYFNEKTDTMIRYVDDVSLPSEVTMPDLPETPCIVVCGSSIHAASRFFLSIDKVIVNDHIPTFAKAFTMMFGTYYCFNIQYPQELGSTLEFMQRCIFRINPEKGTKVMRSKNKKQYSVNPKVLTLITSVADYEWRD